jgi:hypothetical protein
VCAPRARALDAFALFADAAARVEPLAQARGLDFAVDLLPSGVDQRIDVIHHALEIGRQLATLDVGVSFMRASSTVGGQQLCHPSSGSWQPKWWLWGRTDRAWIASISISSSTGLAQFWRQGQRGAPSHHRRRCVTTAPAWPAWRAPRRTRHAQISTTQCGGHT